MLIFKSIIVAVLITALNTIQPTAAKAQSSHMYAIISQNPATGSSDKPLLLWLETTDAPRVVFPLDLAYCLAEAISDLGNHGVHLVPAHVAVIQDGHGLLAEVFFSQSDTGC